MGFHRGSGRTILQAGSPPGGMTAGCVSDIRVFPTRFLRAGTQARIPGYDGDKFPCRRGSRDFDLVTDERNPAGKWEGKPHSICLRCEFCPVGAGRLPNGSFMMCLRLCSWERKKGVPGHVKNYLRLYAQGGWPGRIDQSAFPRCCDRVGVRNKVDFHWGAGRDANGTTPCVSFRNRPVALSRPEAAADVNPIAIPGLRPSVEPGPACENHA